MDSATTAAPAVHPAAQGVSSQRKRILSALEYPSVCELQNKSANTALLFGMLSLALLVPALAASSAAGGSDLIGLLAGLAGGAVCYWLLFRYNDCYAELYKSARYNLESGGILMLTLDRQLPPVEGGFLGLGRSREQLLIQRESLAARIEGLPACYPALCDELRLQGRSRFCESQRLQIMLTCTALVFANIPVYLILGDYPLGALGYIALGLLNILLLRLPLLALRRIERGAFRHALHDCIHGQESSMRPWEAVDSAGRASS